MFTLQANLSIRWLQFVFHSFYTVLLNLTICFHLKFFRLVFLVFSLITSQTPISFEINLMAFHLYRDHDITAPAPLKEVTFSFSSKIYFISPYWESALTISSTLCLSKIMLNILRLLSSEQCNECFPKCVWESVPNISPFHPSPFVVAGVLAF